MGFSLSNILDPAGMFSGDKGDIFGAIIDPGGSTMENFGFESDWRGFDYDDASNWADDLGDGNAAMAKNRWNNWRKGDGLERTLYAGDLYASGSPWGTKLTNEIWHRDDKPIWNTMGGKTSDDYRYAESQGEDTSNNRGVDAVGNVVGNAFLNAFTFGLGSSAVGALDSWGYGDNEGAGDILKKAGKNYAINYVGGPYAASASNIYDAANGGDRKDILKAVGGAAISNAGKLGQGMDYLKNMYSDEMPDVGTIGGTMQDDNGESSTTTGGYVAPVQRDANIQRQQAMSASQPQGGPVEQFLASLGVGGGPKTGMGIGDYAGLANSAFGMYNANKQRKRLQGQQDQLANLFSANSPYAQMARQRMERKDAAAGRRSQYGARETQLAALLADRQAQTMPQQQRYADAIGGYDNMMVNNGVGLGKSLYQNRGRIGQDIDGLMSLFNQGGQ